MHQKAVKRRKKIHTNHYSVSKANRRLEELGKVVRAREKNLARRKNVFGLWGGKGQTCQRNRILGGLTTPRNITINLQPVKKKGKGEAQKGQQLLYWLGVGAQNLTKPHLSKKGIQ